MNAHRYYKFLAYHPYLTFSDPSNVDFVEPDGKRRRDSRTPDVAGLFGIGKEAYERLPPLKSAKHFDQFLNSYFQFINGLRPAIAKLESEGKIIIKREAGDLAKIDWADAEEHLILWAAWKLFPALRLNAQDETKLLFQEVLLCYALREIDNAIIGADLDGRDAIAAAIEATNALSNAIAIESGSEKLQEARRDLAYRGAIARLARDPKQKEKSFIYGCWQKWQQSLSSYPSKAAFARDMLTKCEHLESQKKIEDWCRGWETQR